MGSLSGSATEQTLRGTSSRRAGTQTLLLQKNVTLSRRSDREAITLRTSRIE